MSKQKNIAPPRVIVVDDEPAVRTIVRRMLEPAGYIVEEAADPKQACEAISESGPLDLLIADFRMPEVTGDEVARRFRAAKPDVKVLFITGYADDLFTERSLLWDGEAFLEKPFSKKGLLEAVSLVLFGRFNQEENFAVPAEPVETVDMFETAAAGAA
jgi:two-component system, cell cycle sensor histidine kinase and response regulator CckA